ncbi:MAG: hypothetical protein WCC80_08695, partial [Pseudolabrys sp.]
DSLCARQLYPGAKTFLDYRVRAQSQDIYEVDVTGCVTSGPRSDGRCHVVSYVLRLLRLPPLLAQATKDVA